MLQDTGNINRQDDQRLCATGLTHPMRAETPEAPTPASPEQAHSPCSPPAQDFESGQPQALSIMEGACLLTWCPESACTPGAPPLAARAAWPLPHLSHQEEASPASSPSPFLPLVPLPGPPSPPCWSFLVLASRAAPSPPPLGASCFQQGSASAVFLHLCPLAPHTSLAPALQVQASSQKRDSLFLP